MSNNIELNISPERKKEINKILIETEKKVISGDIKAYSLDEFKEKQAQKRMELRSLYV